MACGQSLDKWEHSLCQAYDRAWTKWNKILTIMEQITTTCRTRNLAFENHVYTQKKYTKWNKFSTSKTNLD
jgi:hypothetical protein